MGADTLVVMKNTKKSIDTETEKKTLKYQDLGKRQRKTALNIKWTMDTKEQCAYCLGIKDRKT